MASSKKSLFKRIVMWTAGIAFAVLTAHVGYYAFYPDISALKSEIPKRTALMEYREAQHQKKKKPYKISQRWAPLKDISPYLRHAVVIAEDDKFWAHGGFDFASIYSAVETDIKEKRFKFGASTISQQLVKNLYLSPSKNPMRKLKEAVLTVRLERGIKKDRILELYLNVVEWGDGIYGAEAASRHYFDKQAIDLSPMESCRLAVVLPSPKRYDPLADTKFITERAEHICGIMKKRGLI